VFVRVWQCLAWHAELHCCATCQGLGELYAEEFVRATSGNVAQDKEEPLRLQAKALFKALCAKLDALTHFHYTPKPVVEELEVGGLAAVLLAHAYVLAVWRRSWRQAVVQWLCRHAACVRGACATCSMRQELTPCQYAGAAVAAGGSACCCEAVPCSWCCRPGAGHDTRSAQPTAALSGTCHGK
jgi:hypothetical protein